MAATGPAVYPPTVEWTIRNPRTGETRTFTQEELTIDGEARLLGLVTQTGAALSDADFPWDKLAALFSVEGQEDIDWPAAIQMLGRVASLLPEIVAESTCIFFGLFPTDEKGARNLAYDTEKAFIRSASKFTQWVEIIQTFARQNDYQRLVAPFGAALTAGATMGRGRSEG